MDTLVADLILKGDAEPCPLCDGGGVSPDTSRFAGEPCPMCSGHGAVPSDAQRAAGASIESLREAAAFAVGLTVDTTGAAWSESVRLAATIDADLEQPDDGDAEPDYD